MSRGRWDDAAVTRGQDFLVWSIGAAALVNELFFQARPRPEAIPIIAVVLGLPFARRSDRSRSSTPRKGG